MIELKLIDGHYVLTLDKGCILVLTNKSQNVGTKIRCYRAGRFTVWGRYSVWQTRPATA
jgi:hypothetical protein